MLCRHGNLGFVKSVSTLNDTKWLLRRDHFYLSGKVRWESSGVICTHWICEYCVNSRIGQSGRFASRM